MIVSAVVFVVAAWQLDPLALCAVADTDRSGFYLSIFEDDSLGWPTSASVPSM